MLKEQIKDLINAIAEGDTSAINDTFETIMSNKIADRLDSMRVDVAQGMFEEGLNEKFAHPNHKKLDKNKNGKIDKQDFELLRKGKEKSGCMEELTLEDYSIDELEDYMMSEEFEQLDELSKATLGSYIKKSYHQVLKHTAASNFKSGRGDSDAFAYSHDEKTMRKEKNRKAGANTAINKLTKEEVEELDEANEIFHQEIGDNHYRVMMNGKTHSTYKGQDAKLKAQAKVKKLKTVKEEVEELDEVSQGTLDSYRKKAFAEPGNERKAGRALAYDKSGSHGDSKVKSSEEIANAKSQIKDIIKPEHHAKYPISKITGFTAARKIYKDASEAGHLI